MAVPPVAVCPAPPADKKAKMEKVSDAFSLEAGLPSALSTVIWSLLCLEISISWYYLKQLFSDDEEFVIKWNILPAVLRLYLIIMCGHVSSVFFDCRRKQFPL